MSATVSLSAAVAALQQMFLTFSGQVLPAGKAITLLQPNQDPGIWIMETARICHEANRGYCAALGDHTQPAWEDAPEWQRQSAIAGVKFIRENPDAPPSASHESWLAMKKAEGWKWGPEKDPVNKLHPCFVPYDQLPFEQKAKDYIFGAIARALLSEAAQ